MKNQQLIQFEPQEPEDYTLQYNGVPIFFKRQNNCVYVNVNEYCKTKGKYVSLWLRNHRPQKILKGLQDKSSTPYTIKAKGKTGCNTLCTWLRGEILITFCKEVDEDFAVWVEKQLPSQNEQHSNDNVQSLPMQIDNIADDNIQVFTSPQFGEIRTAGTPDEPLFCLADLCRVLELTNITEVRKRLKPEGLSQIELLTNGGKQLIYFCSEQNLYKLIMRSDKPQTEPFQDWVCGEVLPSIRKHGMYATEPTINNILNDPDFGIKLLTTLKEERQKNAELTAKNEHIQKENERLERKGAWVDHQMGDDDNLYNWEQAAKHLGLRSHKKLTQFLLDHEIAYRRYNSKNRRWDYYPYAAYADKDFFRIIFEKPTHRDGTPILNQYTNEPCNPKREFRITEYGLSFLHLQLEKAGLIKPIFKKRK